MTNSPKWDTEAVALLEALPGVAYIADESGVCRAVGHRAWNEFVVQEGRADTIQARQLIGRNIFDFVTEGPVRDMTRRIHQTACEELSGRITFYSRCDSPTVERHLFNAVQPIVRDGQLLGVLYQFVAVSERIRPELFFRVETDRVKVVEERALGRLLPLCSYCCRVEDQEGSGHWMSGPSFYRHNGDRPVRVSHGICEDCHAALKSAMEKAGTARGVALKEVVLGIRD